jgi:hypothetical protein
MRTLISVLMLIAGLAAILVALLMIGPVAINLPDSAFGVVLILLLASGGVWLIYKAARRLMRATDSSGPAQSGNGSS